LVLVLEVAVEEVVEEVEEEGDCTEAGVCPSPRRA
jgi:hypothetical protein